MPFTVSTRLGIRSARRCSTISTCDHAALTASFLVTRVLRTLTYWPKNTRAISPNTTINTITAIHPFPTSASLVHETLSMTGYFWIQSLIDGCRYLLNGNEVTGAEIVYFQILSIELALSDVEHLLNCRQIKLQPP